MPPPPKKPRTPAGATPGWMLPGSGGYKPHIDTPFGPIARPDKYVAGPRSSSEVIRHSINMNRRIGPPGKSTGVPRMGDKVVRTYGDPKSPAGAPAGKPGTGGGLRNQSELAAHRAAYDRKVAADAVRRRGSAPRNGPTVPAVKPKPHASTHHTAGQAPKAPAGGRPGIRLPGRVGGGAAGSLLGVAAAFGLDWLQRAQQEADRAANTPTGRLYAAATRAAKKKGPQSSRGTLPRPK